MTGNQEEKDRVMQEAAMPPEVEAVIMEDWLENRRRPRTLFEACLVRNTP